MTYELKPLRCNASRNTSGKTILISNRKEWSDEQIIEAYRSQYLIEAIFKDMKDRTTGSWWPLNHWTDSKLRVHGLYAVCALLRSVMCGECDGRCEDIAETTASELDDIREVINLYPKQRKSAPAPADGAHSPVGTATAVVLDFGLNKNIMS